MFVDRRFGENDATMTLEEKMLLRFAVERKVRPCFLVRDILRLLPLVLWCLWTSVDVSPSNDRNNVCRRGTRRRGCTTSTTGMTKSSHIWVGRWRKLTSLRSETCASLTTRTKPVCATLRGGILRHLGSCEIARMQRRMHWNR
jgi:hypothetical protein